MNFKLRAQLIIASIVIVVSATLTFYHISQEKQFAKERSERSAENIKLTFDSIVRDTEQLYRFRTRATLETPGVMEAVAKRDTQTLYRLILPRYKALQEENPYLHIMQFHAADGRSILRVHMKEKFGDDIASRRAMLQEIHKEHKMVTGFEGGLGGIAFRVIMPIFESGKYIGAVEYGVDSGYFVKKIKDSTGSESIVLIHHEWLGAADRKLYSRGIGNYYYSTILPERKEIMGHFAQQNPNLIPRHLDYKHKEYEVNPLFLEDTKQRTFGMIVTINDVTGANQSISDALIGSLLITLVMVALLWGVIEYTFGALIGKVDLQERYINTILDSQQNIVIVTDGQEIIYANKAFFDYFHFGSLDKFKNLHQCICNFFESEETEQYLMPVMEGGILWTNYLLQNEHKENQVKMTIEGETTIFRVNSKKMEYKGNIRHVVVFTDITRLNELATQDILTGLANRFQFDKALQHSIHMSSRYGRVFSLILVDVDHFKEVNDRYGHLVGDEVLKELAHLLSESVRKSDIVARWGGEELVVLLPDSELSSAAKLAEMLRKRIEEHEFAPLDRLTCSFGVVQWHIGETSDSLLHRVDEKLYAAKEEGRNRVVS
jgi:diguanylate cyclase (GGDEF)-like protein